MAISARSLHSQHRLPPVRIRGPISVTNHLQSVSLGIVRAEGIKPGFKAESFDERLDALLAARRSGLSEEEDAVRRAARDMLRNGRYKPTGRGKPASEYLLRAAENAASFPRVNWPVDVCNYISLSSLLPVSIWDLEKADGTRFLFRVGRPKESYVFNSVGQVISLADLAVGCVQHSDLSSDTPIVNPVKDSMRTKTSEDTRAIAACIYAPVAYSVSGLKELCAVFGEWLRRSGEESSSAGHCVVVPGEEVVC